MDGVTREEINGFGERINKMSIVLSKTEERSERNEDDIKEVKSSLEKFGEKADKISNSVVLGSAILVIGLIIKEVVIK